MRVAGRTLMAVKATDTAFISDDVEDVVIADFDGHLVEGRKEPTKEAPLHGAIYRHFSDVGAVVHCHSPWAVGWSAAHRAIPAATYHASLKIGGPIPVIDTGGYQVPEESIEEVLRCFIDPSPVRAIVLSKHGVVALGQNSEEAACVAELVEETAKIAAIEQLLRSTN